MNLASYVARATPGRTFDQAGMEWNAVGGNHKTDVGEAFGSLGPGIRRDDCVLLVSPSALAAALRDPSWTEPGDHAAYLGVAKVLIDPKEPRDVAALVSPDGDFAVIIGVAA